MKGVYAGFGQHVLNRGVLDCRRELGVEMVENVAVDRQLLACGELGVKGALTVEQSPDRRLHLMASWPLRPPNCSAGLRQTTLPFGIGHGVGVKGGDL